MTDPEADPAASPPGVAGAMPMLVVAAALADRRGRVLVQRRPTGKAHGGLWEFPGGKVEPGETPEAALARELGEELGILVTPTAMTPLAFATEGSGKRPLVLLLYRVTRWRGDPAATDGAADAVAWHTPAGLRTLAMPPADGPLVEALIAAA